MNLIDKLMKNSPPKAEADVLKKSKFFTKKDMVPTQVPMLNVALSGRLDGGLTPGITQIAGPSKHFKTCFSLVLAKAYLDKYKDAAILFYDSEFGCPQGYFEKFGIDTTRIIHTPVTDIEQLKHAIMVQLNGKKSDDKEKDKEKSKDEEGIVRGDKVLILVDSIGNLASKKEVQDAIDGKSVADMTRAKALKSFFRMVGPCLNKKDIPMIIVNHTYDTMELYGKKKVSGGQGSIYNSDNIWIVDRRQIKDKDDLNGYAFTINVEKSRYVKEKSQIPITVTFDEGINDYSGLFDVAREGGFITDASQGWYKIGDQKLRKADIEVDSNIWQKLLKDEKFNAFIEEKYLLGYRKEELSPQPEKKRVAQKRK